MKLLHIIFVLSMMNPIQLYAAQWELLASGQAGFGKHDAIAISPHDTKVIYFSDSGILYRSQDKGEHWEQIVIDGLGGTINNIVINPHNPAIMYVTTLGTTETVFNVSVFKSEDNGYSWEKKYDGISQGIDLKINHFMPNMLYLLSNVLLNSTNGGNTWVPASPDSEPFTPEFLAIDPQNPNILYVSVADTSFTGGTFISGLYKSIDQGQTWTQKIGLSSTPYNSNLPIVINPYHPNILYMSEPSVPRVSKSIDGGDTWQSIHNIAETHNITIDPHHPDIVYLGTQAGLYRSTNAGSTWTELSSTIKFAATARPSISALAIDPQNPETLYVGIENQGLFQVSTDSNCIAEYNSQQNTISIPCLRIDENKALFEIKLTGRETELLFDVSDGQAR